MLRRVAFGAIRIKINVVLIAVMPLINVRTSLPSLKDGSALLQELSAELASQTGKPEAYVMTLLETGVPMTFAGSHEPCAYVEVKSIGALRPPAMTAAFCELIQARRESRPTVCTSVLKMCRPVAGAGTAAPLVDVHAYWASNHELG